MPHALLFDSPVVVDGDPSVKSEWTQDAMGGVSQASALHRRALEAMRRGNEGKWQLCCALFEIRLSRAFIELGFPSVVAYARSCFQMESSETYACLQVADRARTLPAARGAFLRGEIRWSSFKELVRVAQAHSEVEWVAFARAHVTPEVRAEVRDALEKGRSTPRSAEGGLPDDVTTLTLRMRRSDRELLQRGLARLAPHASVDGDDMTSMLLFLARRLLSASAADLLGVAEAADEASSPAMVYQRCPDCRRGAMKSKGGDIVLSKRRLDEEERAAKKVDLESGRERSPSGLTGPAGPTSAALARQVLLRDGYACSNPDCDHRAEQCHHIVFRSRGGLSTLDNEVAVCAACHGLIHQGRLRVEGTPSSGLKWTRVPVESARAESAER